LIKQDRIQFDLKMKKLDFQARFSHARLFMKEDVDPEMMTSCLWGCAMGDALGLPFENLSPKRIGKWLGKKPLRHRFLLGWGMISDDTEHSLIVARCLLRHLGDPEGFETALAREFRYWIAGIPAGIGLATA